jgi:hypothetical protein
VIIKKISKRFQKILKYFSGKSPQFRFATFFITFFSFGALIVLFPDPALADSLSEQVYDTVLTMASYIAQAIASAMSSLLIWLIDIMITIIKYDAFNQPGGVIDRGWPLVRDAVNMFVILALLAIAITNLIPGRGDIGQTQKQLISLLTAVILMNFSRTIALLAVDFSQVITMTFATAVSDIAAGNFLRLFSIQQTLVIDASPQSLTANALGGAEFFGTIVIKLLMLFVAILSIGMLIAAFLVRIMLLWILIVISPLAFFAFGLKDVSGKLSGIYSEWMSQFTGMLIFGPTLMFFMWLSLSVSSGGDIATATGFMKTETTNTGLLEVASASSIMNSVVAMALLWIGIQQAAKAASSVQLIGGIMAKNQSLVGSAVRKSAKVGGAITAVGATGGLAAGVFGLAGAGVLAGATGVAVTGNTKNATAWTGKKIGRVASKTGSFISNIPVVSYIPGVSAAGNALARAGGRLGKASDDYKNQDRIEARKALAAMDDEAKVAEFNRFMSNPSSPFLNRGAVSRGEEMKSMFLSDKDFRDKAMSMLGETGFNDLMRQVVNSDSSLNGITDEKEKAKVKEQMFKTKAANLHLIEDKDGKTRQQLIEEIIKNPDFKPNMISAASLMSDEGADIVRQLKNQVVRQETYRDNNGVMQLRDVTAAEDVLRSGDRGAQEAYRNADPDWRNVANPTSSSTPTFTPAQNKRAAELGARNDDGRTGWQEISATDLQADISSNAIDVRQIPLDKLNAATLAGIQAQYISKLSALPNFADNINKMSDTIFRGMGTAIIDSAVSVLDTADIARLGADKQNEIRRQMESRVTTAAGANLGPNDSKIRAIVANGGRGNIELAYTHAGNFQSLQARTDFESLLNSNPSTVTSAPEIADINASVVTQLQNRGSGFYRSINQQVNDAISSGDTGRLNSARAIVRQIRRNYNAHVAANPDGADPAVDAFISRFETTLP